MRALRLAAICVNPATNLAGFDQRRQFCQQQIARGIGFAQRIIGAAAIRVDQCCKAAVRSDNLLAARGRGHPQQGPRLGQSLPPRGGAARQVSPRPGALSPPELNAVYVV